MSAWGPEHIPSGASLGSVGARLGAHLRRGTYFRRVEKAERGKKRIAREQRGACSCVFWLCAVLGAEMVRIVLTRLGDSVGRFQRRGHPNGTHYPPNPKWCQQVAGARKVGTAFSPPRNAKPGLVGSVLLLGEVTAPRGHSSGKLCAQFVAGRLLAVCITNMSSCTPCAQ